MVTRFLAALAVLSLVGCAVQRRPMSLPTLDAAVMAPTVQPTGIIAMRQARMIMDSCPEPVPPCWQPYCPTTQCPVLKVGLYICGLEPSAIGAEVRPVGSHPWSWGRSMMGLIDEAGCFFFSITEPTVRLPELEVAICHAYGCGTDADPLVWEHEYPLCCTAGCEQLVVRGCQ